MGTVRRGRLSVVVCGVATAAVMYTAFRVHGEYFAAGGDAVLQTAVCAAAIGFGTLFAVKNRGAARAWRLLIVAATAC